MPGVYFTKLSRKIKALNWLAELGFLSLKREIKKQGKGLAHEK
jgi:hypothetical protein